MTDASGERAAAHILVVDDEPAYLRLMETTVEGLGYTVHCASSGLEALECIKRQALQLIVLDVMMPYMDGFEVYQTIRKGPEPVQTPVLLLVAKAADGYYVDVWDTAAGMYTLLKPFTGQELTAAIHKIGTGQVAA